MGKYSDIDIDAMLKRIQDNVDKQSNDKGKEKVEKPKLETHGSTPEEIINMVMADIGERGGAYGRSADLDQYDISGFEIEEIDDPEEEAADEGSEAVEEVPEAPTETEEEAESEIKPEEEPTCAITEESEDEAEAEETVEDIVEEPTDLFDELSTDSEEEEVDEGEAELDEIIADDQYETEIEEVIEEAAEEAEETDVIAESDEDIEITEEEAEVEPEVDLEDVIEEEPEEELTLEILPDIVALPPEDEDIAELLVKHSEELQEDIVKPAEAEAEEASDNATDEACFEEEIGDLRKMPKVTKVFSKYSVESSGVETGEVYLGEEEGESYSGLDYSDMNLAMSLGSKDSLESAYGFVKVSEAKHNFVNTERKGSGSNVILDNRGKEYRTFDQNMEIKEAYRKEKKRIGKRVIVTAIIFLFITLCEMMYPTGVLAEASEYMSVQLRYNIISFMLFAIAVSFSAKKLLRGVIGFFTTRSNYYTVIGFVSLFNIVYSLLVLSVFNDRDMLMLNSVTVLGILIIIVGEYMQVMREIQTFELASDGNPKISLEKVDITAETIKKESFVDSNDFVIENTNFVGRYFERSARTPGIYHIRHTFVTLTMLVSLFVAVTAVILTRDFADFIFVIELCALLCVPVQIVFFGSYAFYITSKKLLKLDSAIIGETLVDEYVGSNTIYLDDVEVFGRHGVHVVNLEPFNNFNIIDVNYYYLSVFSKVSGPLKNAFGEVPENMKLSDNVVLVNIFSNGIEATVDEKNRVLVGKSDFLVSKGVHMGKATDDKYNEKGDVSIMYIAVNGALCAKLYLKYSVTHHFEKFAEDMAENGSIVGVRTLDPNITEEMIARLRPEKDSSIKVMRPTLNDLVPIGRRSDSGIITEKNPHMIARILAEGLKVKKVNDTMNVLWVIYSILGVGMVIAFMLLGIFNRILPIYVIVYQLVWFIGLVIYIKNKLRNGKSR